jgi:hypothetical protein
MKSWVLKGCLAAGVIAAALTACAGPDPDAVASPDSNSPPAESLPATAGDRVPGEYIVTLSPDAGVEVIARALAAYAPVLGRDLGEGRYLVHVGTDPGPDKVSAAVRGEPAIKAVQPNFVYRTTPPASDRKLPR